MTGREPASGGEYSGCIGFIYVFNLIVGFGALTLPYLVNESGYILGSLFLAVLGTVSFITLTFIVETMSIGNAVLELKLKQGYIKVSLEDSDSNGRETSIEMSQINKRSKTRNLKEISSHGNIGNHKTDPFELKTKLELADLAKIFLGARGSKVLVLVTAAYLYGDLAIYATSTPTALVSVYSPSSFAFIGDIEDPHSFAYNAWLCLFAIIVVPLSCLNIQKTKQLQLMTCTYRNLAIAAMIGLAIAHYRDREVYQLQNHTNSTYQEGEEEFPNNPADFHKLPHLFGAATYSFMCHHSIPSIIFPVEAKARKNIFYILFCAYIAVLLSYLLLCLSAKFAFGPGQINQLYILNFSDEGSFWSLFLEMLPVFITVTNYPLIAITTRNNLIGYFNKAKNVLCSGACIEEDNVPRIWHSLVVALPPIAVAFAVRDLGVIVEITGSYAGLALEFLFPTWLLYSARKILTQNELTMENSPYRSPFNGTVMVLVICWSLTSLFFIVMTQVS